MLGGPGAMPASLYTASNRIEPNVPVILWHILLSSVSTVLAWHYSAQSAAKFSTVE